MKRIVKIAGLCLSVAAVFGLASCSNEINEPNNNLDNTGSTLPSAKLVKTPEFKAWSGATKSTWIDEETGKAYYQHDDEVEINLSILDQREYDYGNLKISDLVNKLSIHVRCATDVTVKMPVPVDYIIDSDDLFIFNEHYNVDEGYHGVYGHSLYSWLEENEETGIQHSLSYPISITNENGVEEKFYPTVTVTFGEEDITVKVTGVTDEVLAYCLEHNHDGLNFEVYTYYQTAAIGQTDDGKYKVEAANPDNNSKGKLQEYLNDTKVEFTGAPAYFINSYGYEPVAGADYTLGNIGYTSARRLYDCKVTPVSNAYVLVKGKVSEEVNAEPVQIEHLNGTPYNTVYYNNTVIAADKVDHAHGGIYVDYPNDEEEVTPVIPQE